MPVEMKEEAEAILKDDKIDEHEEEVAKTILGLYIKMIDKEAELLDTVKADYEDKLKKKDDQLVQICTVLIGAMLGTTIFEMIGNGYSPVSIILLGVKIGLGMLMSVGVMFIKAKFPSLLMPLIKGTEILKPLADPVIATALDKMNAMLVKENGN